MAVSVLLTMGAFSSGCSSPPEPPRTDASEFQGTVTILNLTNEMHSITIDPLSSEVSIDCDAIAADPGAMLNDALFQDPFTQSFTVPLFSGEELAVDPAEWLGNWSGFDGRPCRAFRVSSPALRDIVVFYGNQWDTKRYYHNIDLDPNIAPDDQTIVIEADYSKVEDEETLHSWREYTCPIPEEEGWWSPQEFEWDNCSELPEEDLIKASTRPPGARYSWSSVNNGIPLHFERSRAEEGTAIRIPARCRVPDAGDGLFWEDFRWTLSDFQLRSVDIGRDGCHTLHLYSESVEGMNDDGTLEWLLCAPYETISPLLSSPDARLRIEANNETSLRISVAQHPEITEVLFTRGRSFPSFYDIRWEHEVRQGCAPIDTSCDEVTLPIDLRLTSSRNQLVVPGESVDVGYGSFYLVRAAYKPVINLRCEQDQEQFIDLFGDVGFEPFVEGVLTVKE